MIQYKKQYAKAVLQWFCLLSLIPLSLSFHQGFFNLFGLVTILFALSSVCIIGNLLIHLASMAKNGDDSYDKMDNADKTRELKKECAKAIGMEIYRKGGVDKINAEKEQNHLDLFFIWATIIYLIFSGHIFFGLIWLLRLPTRGILQCAYEGFDDALLDEI